MKALIAAGGRSTRLRPISYTLNKHLMPLANRPMLSYVFDRVAQAGVTDGVVNVNPGGAGAMRDGVGGGGGGRGGSGPSPCAGRRGGGRGSAHAVANAEPYLRGDSFVFFLGDNIMAGDISPLRRRFEQEGLDCLVTLSRVKDPNRFGVPEFGADGSLIRTVEKPDNPPSPFAVTGIYFFNDRYFDGFKTMTPSARGEYEITDMITWFIRNGKVGHEEITGWWKDTGKPDDLLEGNALLLDELTTDETSNRGTVDETVQIQGKVTIGAGSVIGPNVLIRGPVVIGERTRVEQAYVGPYTSIGNDVVLRNTEIEHSIVFDGAEINCGKRIVDSIIGSKTSIRSTQQSLPRGHKLILGDHGVVEL